MARNYGKIEVATWQSSKFRSLSDDAKILYLYMIACPHGNAIGCFRLPLGYIQDDMQWDMSRVSKHVSELASRRMIERDEKTSLTFIVGWWGHNTIENRFVAIGATKVIASLPRCAVFNNAISALDAAKDTFTDKAKDVFRDVAKQRIETKEPEPEPEPEPESPPTEDADASKGVGQDDVTLKEKLFGNCLAWLIGKTKLKRQPAAAIIGKWIRDHGEAEVLRAFNVAARESPPDPVAYMTRVLKPKATHGKPDAKAAAAAHLEGLADVFGIGPMGSDPAEPAQQGRIIEGDCRVVGRDDPGNGPAVRTGVGGPDRVRNSLRDPVPGAKGGPENLSRSPQASAGGSADAGHRPRQGVLGMGQSDAIPGRYPDESLSGVRQAPNAAGTRQGGHPEGAGSVGREERHIGGEMEGAEAKPETNGAGSRHKTQAA